jgi:hypothetical protein
MIEPVQPNLDPVSVIKINVTNVADLDVDTAADVDNDMDAEVFDDVAITTHLFMGQYQKWPT